MTLRKAIYTLLKHGQKTKQGNGYNIYADNPEDTIWVWSDNIPPHEEYVSIRDGDGWKKKMVITGDKVTFCEPGDWQDKVIAEAKKFGKIK